MTRPPDKQYPYAFTGRQVLVGVCGGIAAYKVCEVVSTLVQCGAGVTVAMTKAARKFVTPLTFGALSGRPVLTDLWRPDQADAIAHISSTGTADLFLIAPATANMIGKMAQGIADELLSTLAVSVGSAVLLAPAMNERMWSNAIVQRNVDTLKEVGYRIVGPGEGWLACRSVGAGRMAEPDEILEAVASILGATTTEPAPQGR